MRIVELRRHTAADGDALTDEGVQAALSIGVTLAGDYLFAVSSGMQRATQTIACFLAALGETLPGGVIVDGRFAEDSDPATLGRALGDVFQRLSDGGRALVVGHSPMTEKAIEGLTGRKVGSLSKGAGVRVTEDGGAYTVEELGV